MIQMSSRKRGKSFASLVTAGWQLKERMGSVCAPFHNFDLPWDQNVQMFFGPASFVLGSTDQLRILHWF